jgi:hypothetical protein
MDALREGEAAEGSQMDCARLGSLRVARFRTGL